MASGRRHHYVPVFFLGHFCNPDGKLRVFDKISGDASLVTSPRNVAVERGFYRVDLEVDDPETAERLLGDIESQAAPVIQGLLDGNALLSPPDKGVLATFMATQVARSPRSRRAIERIVTEAVPGRCLAISPSATRVIAFLIARPAPWTCSSLSLMLTSGRWCGANGPLTPMGPTACWSPQPQGGLDAIEAAFDARCWTLGARLLQPVGAPAWDRPEGPSLFAWDPDNCARVAAAWRRLREHWLTVLSAFLRSVIRRRALSRDELIHRGFPDGAYTACGIDRLNTTEHLLVVSGRDVTCPSCRKT